jgi:heme/copper-type cytochrome/quinol oxidase subunit 2
MKSRYALPLVILALLVGGANASPVEPTEQVAASTPEEEIPVKRVKMWARNWEWTPDLIRVKKGTRVVINFISEDASHAFFLKAYKIKVNLPQDTKAQIEFIADKAGSFKWRCSRPCGNGCAKMVGTLEVFE